MAKVFALDGAGSPTLASAKSFANATAMTFDSGSFYYASLSSGRIQISMQTGTGPITPQLTPDISSNLPVTSLCIKDTQVYYTLDKQIFRINTLGKSDIVAGKVADTPTTSIIQGGLEVVFGKVGQLVYDSVERLFYFTDPVQGMLFSMNSDGAVTRLFTGTGNYTMKITKQSITSFGSIPGIQGLAIAPDGTLYASVHVSPYCILRLTKDYDATGAVTFWVTPYVGYASINGLTASSVAAAYSAINLGPSGTTPVPMSMAVGPAGELYFLETGTSKIKKITPESKNTFFKGYTGTLRYAPIQVIGNATIETYTTMQSGSNNVSASQQNAISTTLYTTDMDADDQGNVYFCDQKLGVLYQLNSSNKLTNCCPTLTASLAYACVVQNTSVAAFTKDATGAKGYLVNIAAKTSTQSPLQFAGILAVCAHPAGWVFILEGGTLSYTNAALSIKTQLLTNVVTVTDQQLCSMSVDADQGILYLSAFTTTGTSCISKIPLTITPTGITAQSPTSLGTLQKITSIFFSQQDKTLYASQAPKRSSTLVSDSVQNRIVAINPTNGVATTIVGSMRSGAPVDGATIAGTTLQCPEAVCVDRQGNSYLADARPYASTDPLSVRNSVLVRAPSKFFMRDSYVYALAGTGVKGYSGDGGPAPLAQFSSPCGVCTDSTGNIYVADSVNHRVRRIDAITETITTFAGTGAAPSSVPIEGGSATTFPLLNPIDVKVSPNGVVYIADKTYSIRRVTPTATGTQCITYVGVPSLSRTSAPSVPATGAIANATPIGDVTAMCIDAQSTLYVATQSPNCVFMVDTINRIRQIATLSFAPSGLAINGTRTFLYVTDAVANRVSQINVSTGSVTSLNLTGLNAPRGIVCDPTGNNLYIANTGGNQILKAPVTGNVAPTVYLGVGGTADFADSTTIVAGIRDGIPVGQARVLSPYYMFMNAYGRLFFTEGGADSQSHRIRTIPTDALLDSCAIIARKLRVEAAAPGRDIGITSIGVFTKNVATGTTTVPTALSSVTPSSANNSAVTDFGADTYISYITVRGSAATIGAKIYMYNSNNEIISVRVLGPECTTTAGQTILYAVPWSQGCQIPAFVPLRTPCGITEVTAISIPSTAEKFASDVFDSFRAVYLDSTGTIQTVQSGGTTYTFTSAVEFLGLFIFPKPLANLTNTSVTLTANTTYTKTILATSPTNTRFEFVDFRVSSSDYGCATLDSIYRAATGLYRIRYVRIIGPTSLGEVQVISAETGKNLARGLPIYTSIGTIFTDYTNEDLLKTTPINLPNGWVEVDLGDGYPVEQIILTPTVGNVENYTVRAFTERRDDVPLPTSATNPLSKTTKTFYMHNSSLFNQILQTTRLQANAYSSGSTVISNIINRNTATANAKSSVDTNNLPINAITDDTSQHHGLTSNQYEWFTVTLNTDQRIQSFTHRNRTDCCQFRQYSNTIIQLNTLGFPLQRNALLGHIVDGTNYTQTFTDTLTNQFAIPIPRSIGGFSTGIRGVRYVRYINTNAIAADPYIQISQLVVRDVAGVNRAIGLPNSSITYGTLATTFTNTNADAYMPISGQLYPSAVNMYHSQTFSKSNDFYQIDLGANYEIDHVVYYGRGATCDNSWLVNWNTPDFNYRAAGAQLALLDINNNVLAIQSLTGWLRRESLDFRPEATARNSRRIRYIRIEQPGIILSNANITSFTSIPGIEIAAVKVYDIYNRNVAVGKTVSTFNYDLAAPSNQYGPIKDTPSSYSPSNYPGSYWELDLGQEYSIYKLDITVGSQDKTVYTNTPVILYDDDKQPIRRMYLTAREDTTSSVYSISIGNPQYLAGKNSVQPEFVPRATAGRRARLIEIRGTMNTVMQIRQVVAIDKNGLNVAMGKPTISSDPPERPDAGSSITYPNPAYNAVNGRGDGVFSNKNTTYTSGDSSTFYPYLMIDLGGEYSLTSIHLYHTTNVSDIFLYDNNGALVTQRSPVDNNIPRFIWTIDSNGPQQCYPSTGRRARYVRWMKDNLTWSWSNLCINSQFVVIDSMGRNVVLNKQAVAASNYAGSGANSLFNGKYKASVLNDTTYHSRWIDNDFRTENFIEVDLGAEYLISDVVVYTSNYLSLLNNGNQQPSANYTVTLRDLYQHETYKGTIGDKNNHVNIIRYADIIRRPNNATTCPAGTTLDTGDSKCYGSCGTGIVNPSNSRECLQECSTEPLDRPDLTNQTICRRCSTSYITSGIYAGKCLAACPSGYGDLDQENCVETCGNDGEGNPTVFNRTSGQCETQPLPNSAITNLLWWNGSSAIFQANVWTTRVISNYWTNNEYYSDVSNKRARKIYRYSKSIIKRNPPFNPDVSFPRPAKPRPYVSPVPTALSSTDPSYKLLGGSETVGYRNYLDWNGYSNTTVRSMPTTYRWDVFRAYNNPAYVLGCSMAEVLNLMGTMTPYPWYIGAGTYYPYSNTVPNTDPDPAGFPYVPNKPAMVCPAGFFPNPNTTGAADACMNTTCSDVTDYFDPDDITLRTGRISSLSTDKSKCYSPCPAPLIAMASDQTKCIADCTERYSTITPTQCIPRKCNSDETLVIKDGREQCLKCEGTDPNGNPYIYDRALSLQVYDTQCYKSKRPDVALAYSNVDDHYRQFGKNETTNANKGTLEPGCEFKCVTALPPTTLSEGYKLIGWFNMCVMKAQKWPDAFYWASKNTRDAGANGQPLGDWDIFPNSTCPTFDINNTSITRRIYTKDPTFRDPTQPTNRTKVNRTFTTISYSQMVLPT